MPSTCNPRAMTVHSVSVQSYNITPSKYLQHSYKYCSTMGVIHPYNDHSGTATFTPPSPSAGSPPELGLWLLTLRRSSDPSVFWPASVLQAFGAFTEKEALKYTRSCESSNMRSCAIISHDLMVF